MNGPLRGSGSPSSLKITASVPKTGAEWEGVAQKSAWRSGLYRRKGTFISSGPEIPERGAVRWEKMVGLELCVCVCVCVCVFICVYVCIVWSVCMWCMCICIVRDVYGCGCGCIYM